MSAEFVTAIATAIGTILLGGLGLFLVNRANARKTEAEAAKIESETESAADASRAAFEAKLREELLGQLQQERKFSAEASATAARALDDLQQAFDKIRDLERRLEDCEQKHIEQAEQIAALSLRVEALSLKKKRSTVRG